MSRVPFFEMPRLSLALLLPLLVACGKTPPAPSPAPTGGPVDTPTAAPIVDEKPPPKDEAVPADDTKTFFVDSKWIECEGEGPMKCMRVKHSADGDWELMYSGIDGFEFEEGHSYELKVKVAKVGDPPAGGSSLKYTLVEVVSKKKEAK